MDHQHRLLLMSSQRTFVIATWWILAAAAIAVGADGTNPPGTSPSLSIRTFPADCAIEKATWSTWAEPIELASNWPMDLTTSLAADSTGDVSRSLESPALQANEPRATYPTCTEGTCPHETSQIDAQANPENGIHTSSQREHRLINWLRDKRRERADQVARSGHGLRRERVRERRSHQEDIPDEAGKALPPDGDPSAPPPDGPFNEPPPAPVPPPPSGSTANID